MEEQRIMFGCDFCNNSFSDEDMLSLHVMTIHKSIIEGQKSPFVKDSKNKVEGKKTFDCKQCEKTYNYSSHLKRHIRATHENNMFDCTECGKQFKTKGNLLRHEKNVHDDGKKTYKCDLCKKVFRYMIGLQRHISAIHKKNRVACDKCEKTAT